MTETTKEEVRQTAADWTEVVARIGYVAKGIVYLMVGGIAIKAAFQAGNRAEGSTGAFVEILEQPYGRIPLAFVAAGMAAYAFWRFVQALVDPEDKGSDAKGIATRVMYAGSGLIHVSLTFAAIRLIRYGTQPSDGTSSTEERTAWLMQQPYGRWLVGAAGIGVVGWALYQLYKAWKTKLSSRLDLHEVDREARDWVIHLSRAGIAARGVVFSIAGAFIVLAAVRTDPESARGLEQALRWLQDQAYGPALLAITGTGLGCYGAYMLVKSRYRDIG